MQSGAARPGHPRVRAGNLNKGGKRSRRSVVPQGRLHLTKLLTFSSFGRESSLGRTKKGDALFSYQLLLHKATRVARCFLAVVKLRCPSRKQTLNQIEPERFVQCLWLQGWKPLLQRLQDSQHVPTPCQGAACRGCRPRFRVCASVKKGATLIGYTDHDSF